ncbi:MAG: heavy metal translocating P-type ATPase [Brevinematia bacterium]
MKKYVLKNLDCSNCAFRIEKHFESRGFKVNVDFVNSVIVTKDNLNLETVKKLVKEVEEEVEVLEEQTKVESKFKFKDFAYHFFSIFSVVIYGIFHSYIHANKIVDLLVVFVLLIFSGWRVFYKAFKEILNKHFFEENFLISTATIAAIIIHETFEGLLLISLFNIGEFIQELAVERSRKSLINKVNEIFGKVRVLREGLEVYVDPNEVNVGETLILRPGERLLLDGRVLSGKGFVDTSSITGESAPRFVGEGDIVESGSISIDGVLFIQVVSTFDDSSLSKIVSEVQKESNKSSNEKFITYVSKFYTPVVIVIAFLISVLPPFITGIYNFEYWIYKGLILLVISCPCAIVISVPLVYFRSVMVMASNNIFVKGTSYLDNLTKVKVLILDKTGTITEGKFEIDKIIPKNGFNEDKVSEIALTLSNFSNHAIAKSIRSIFNINKIEFNLSTVQEIPGMGIIGKVNEDTFMLGNDRMLHENQVPHDDCGKTTTSVHVVKNNVHCGIITLSDRVRDSIYEFIHEIRRRKIEKIYVLTGDNQENTYNVLKGLNIDQIYTNLKPFEKASTVEYIKSDLKKRELCVYIGDGINDSIAMKKADIGIAFNAPINSVQTISSDIVIASDDLNKIVKLIDIASNTKNLVIQNLLIGLGIKFLVAFLGMFGFVHLWLAVLSDVGTALINIFYSLTKDLLKPHRS